MDNAQINDLRQRIYQWRKGEAEMPDREEMKAVYDFLRKGRTAAQTAQSAKKKPAVELPEDLNDLFK